MTGTGFATVCKLLPHKFLCLESSFEAGFRCFLSPGGSVFVNSTVQFCMSSNVNELKNIGGMWTSEKTLRLIELLHSMPCLWNYKCPDYKDRTKKKIAMQTLADEFNMTFSDMEKKIHSLRTQFRREHKKVTESTRNGCPPKKCAWFGYEPLSFLLQGNDLRANLNDDYPVEIEISVSPFGNEVDSSSEVTRAHDLRTEEGGNVHTPPRNVFNVPTGREIRMTPDFQPEKSSAITNNFPVSKSVINVPTTNNDTRKASDFRTEEQGISSNREFLTPKSVLTVRTGSETRRTPSYQNEESGANCKNFPTPKSTVSNVPTKRKAVEEKRSDDVHNTTVTSEDTTKRDEYSVYGEHIANKLRNCGRNRYEICVAEHKINNIIFELEMGAYENNNFARK